MAHIKEEIFTNASAKEAQDYQKSRGRPYPPAVYEHVLDYHTSHGGQTNLVVDLGCGPGIATRDLVKYFKQTIGADASAEMINAANSLIPDDAQGRLSFFNFPAEQINEIPNLAPESIDLITAATAAHWFDLPAFYNAALTALKPGGTIAIWVHGRYQVADDQPYAAEINQILDDQMIALLPWHQKGLSKLMKLEKNSKVVPGGDMYEYLPLPWTCEPAISGYDPSSFQRTILENTPKKQILPEQLMKISAAEKAFGSGSPIMKWRKEHPDLVDTDQDIVKTHFNKVRKLLGVEDAELKMASKFGILTWRRAA